MPDVKRGKVKRWIDRLHFGFVVEEESQKEFLAHRDELICRGARRLREGEEVEFQVGSYKGKEVAVSVTSSGGQPINNSGSMEDNRRPDHRSKNKGKKRQRDIEEAPPPQRPKGEDTPNTTALFLKMMEIMMTQQRASAPTLVPLQPPPMWPQFPQQQYSQPAGLPHGQQAATINLQVPLQTWDSIPPEVRLALGAHRWCHITT